MKPGSSKVRNKKTGEIATILQHQGYDVKEDVQYYLARTQSREEIRIKMPIGVHGEWEEIT